MNSPFSLLRNTQDIEELQKQLEKFGFEIIKMEKPESAYEDVVIDLAIGKLKKASIAIVIQRRWLSDGLHHEDCHLSILKNGESVFGLNIENLLRQKHSLKLRQLIFNQLLGRLSEIRADPPMT